MDRLRLSQNKSSTPVNELLILGVKSQSKVTSPLANTLTQFTSGDSITVSPTTVMDIVEIFKEGIGHSSSVAVITKVYVF